jgi:hypothetical protein
LAETRSAAVGVKIDRAADHVGGRVTVAAVLVTHQAATDELVIKVLIALRLPEVDVTALVQTHRRQLVEMMQRYTRLKEDATDADLALVLVVDAEIYRLDALIRWLDSAGTRVERQTRDATLPVASSAVPETEVVR